MYVIILINYTITKFTMEEEINNELNFLDITSTHNHTNFTFSIFRKPSQINLSQITWYNRHNIK